MFEYSNIDSSRIPEPISYLRYSKSIFKNINFQTFEFVSLLKNILRFKYLRVGSSQTPELQNQLHIYKKIFKYLKKLKNWKY